MGRLTVKREAHGAEAEPALQAPAPLPVYYCMADSWQSLIEEVVLELLVDLGAPQRLGG